MCLQSRPILSSWVITNGILVVTVPLALTADTLVDDTQVDNCINKILISLLHSQSHVGCSKFGYLHRSVQLLTDNNPNIQISFHSLILLSKLISMENMKVKYT